MLSSFLDGATDLVGAVMSCCFALVPSPPAALVLTSLLLAIVTVPLTLRAARLGRAHAALQPRMAEVRAEHAGDPAAHAAAVRDLFREAGISPFGPLLIGLLQAPVPLLLLRSVHGLVHRDGAGAAPRHVGGALAEAVRTTGVSLGGVDLGTSALAALQGPPQAALLVGALVAVVLLVALVPRRLARGRVTQAGQPPLLDVVSRLAPLAAVASALIVPLALAISGTTMAAARMAALWYAERRPPSI